MALEGLSEVKLEVTHRCSLSCIHCSGSAGPSSQREVELAAVLSILDEAAAMGARGVEFSGGEPLLWPGLADAAVHATERSLRVGVYSSGTAPSVPDILERLRLAGATRLALSVYGSTPETHDWVTRVDGSLLKVLHAAQVARELDLDTEFHFVPMRRNWRDFLGVADLAYTLGVQRMSVLRLVPQGRAALIPDQALTRLENINLRSIIQRIRRDGRVEVRLGSPYNFLGLSTDTPCNSGLSRLIIDPSLRVFPCDALKGLDSEVLKTLPAVWSLDSRTLAECWAASPFLVAVRNHLTEPHPEPCVSCQMIDRCGSGCLGQKIRLTGDLRRQPDPMCLRREQEAR